MKIEARKFSLIERLMRLRNESTLNRFEQLLQQVEMEERAQESVNAIAEGEVLTLEAFKEQARKWIQLQKHTR